MVEAAGGQLEVESDEEEGGENDDDADEAVDGMDEAMEEVDGDGEDIQHAPSDVIGPKKLSTIQRACLEFCIALLNQSITRREYDSPLVCALAVLGIKEDGWRGAEDYPPILSAVIKVARFMVVQQALELSEPFREDEFDSDSAYESDDTGHPPRRRPKGCLQLVQEMTDKFMVRGSHGPM